MIRTLVVDDHTMVRTGLCRLLDSEPDIQVVAQSGSGREAVQLCRQHTPDVVVLDYSLPDLDGLETTRQIVALGLNARVLILTMYANEEYATRVIRAGASGFIVKVASTDELLVAIRKVASAWRVCEPFHHGEDGRQDGATEGRRARSSALGS